jgi:hypothetical protein
MDTKAALTHADNIQPASPDHSSLSSKTGDEKIIDELEHHGEEIGLTWRSIGAASVSNVSKHNLPAESNSP